MNELALMFDKMNVDTNDVIMQNKWNLLNLNRSYGHCIVLILLFVTQS